MDVISPAIGARRRSCPARPVFARSRTLHRRSLPLGLSLPPEEVACAAIFAFFAMQGSIPGIAPAQALEMTGSAPTAYTTMGGIASQLCVHGAIVILLLRHPRLLLRNLMAAPLAALLALLAIASTAWSLDPLLTLRRSLPFALAGAFGLWFAARFSLSRQLSILRLAMLGLAWASVILVLLAPSIGLDHTPGHAADWQGVFTQKNACGRIMVLASMIVLFEEGCGGGRWMRLAVFLFVLFMSGSRGAWLIEAAMLLLWLCLWIARRCGARARLLLTVLVPLLAAGGAAVLAWQGPRLIRLLGRDPSLSGRTTIWPQVLHFIAQRPLLGYGYDAFWRGMQGPSMEVNAAVHFIVEHAHNGFLEIALELGLTGLLLFVVSWGDAWRRIRPLWRSGRIGPVAFPMAILVLIALYDLDENTLLIYNGLFWVLYVAALVNIAIATRDHRHIGTPSPHAMLMGQCDSAPDP